MAKIEIEVDIPSVAHIIVTGGMQCGKSIILDRIEKAIRAEFGDITVSSDLDQVRAGQDLDNLEQWEIDMVKETKWFLHERNIPNKPTKTGSK
ncbi:MAG: hypothetical protein CL678_14540 [Bdellovibrionaceae bacterium]|nr:hypothetical protein [Pseudobdellovibrionaceae bacterium]|tara:strand:+ start:84 stop:362 length:279 start_codon:yes stop_codon:yes gene_type:complete